MPTDSPVPPLEALQRLRDGNRRWVSDVRSIASLGAAARREALTAGQSPFAVVLSCSDSRAPSEMIFDQGLGELFVVRVAGNVVAPSLVGSIEFAVQAFGVGLVVVMGHTSCGAVSATLDAIKRGESGSENVLDIVRRIRPAIEPIANGEDDRAKLMERAARANVRASVAELRTGSKVLAEGISAGRVMVVGAEYSLASGEVDFFDLPAGVTVSA